ncbi:thymidylate synthase [Vespertilionid gammaherpesvirus 1]|uniref:Thymidylate synthase n=1 Tax=Vespertilionid gammaherpesvirus 1 TaxID=2560830 RepID=A0A0X9YAZ7_9GAMA|nr:thymidylate synthase [Myotis gammaherpesvirus 8]AMA67428.1 thymidylate synthase [Vespertilionid gammaherpesvirus 1]
MAINHDEKKYLDLIRTILEQGIKRDDRTGVGTLSIFGTQTRYSLRGQFPLFTTKTVFWRGVVEELLWFLSGSTNSNDLAKKGVAIWNANGSKEFQRKVGLDFRSQGDLGPVYGFQWRFFGAEYKGCESQYTGKGVDQIQNLIEGIQVEPYSRRHVLTAWNPAQLSSMVLPPCHIISQFYVANGELSCQLYQRSADMGLGVPFNVASYSLLTYMIAHLTGLTPGEFIHTIGDAHVYMNHIEPLKLQLTREPLPFPTLSINKDIKNIEDFKFEDFILENYKHAPTIHMQMAL